MTRYWLWWFIITIPVGFLIPETTALIRHRPRDTLSENVWRLERFIPHQAIGQWTAFHFLFTAVFIVLTMWLIGHFGWGIWR